MLWFKHKTSLETQGQNGFKESVWSVNDCQDTKTLAAGTGAL